MKKILSISSVALGVLMANQVLAQNLCDINYQQVGDWGNGGQFDVTLINKGPSINSWELCWTFNGNEQIYGIWDATYSANGNRACIKNSQWNGALASNASAKFGFIFNGQSAGKPNSLTLNGQSCAQAPQSSVAASSSANVQSSLANVMATTIQAENWDNQNGLQTQDTTDTNGGKNVGWIDAGDWASYPTVNLPCDGKYKVEYRVASQSGGGQIWLERAGGSPKFGEISIGAATGGWQTWKTISHEVTLPKGDMRFGLAFKQAGFNINWFSVTPMCLGTPASSSKPAISSSAPSSSSAVSSSAPASSSKPAVSSSAPASSSKPAVSSSAPSSTPVSSSAPSSVASSVASSVSVPVGTFALNASESYLNFISTKKNSVLEISTFTGLSGTITADGVATLVIDLATVSTNIATRDQRMQAMLFEVANYPTATATVNVPVNVLSGIAIGNSAKVPVTASLNLHGVTAPISTTLSVQRMSSGRIIVQTLAPIVIKAGDFALTAGLESLRAIAGLADPITSTVPVDFYLVFDGNGVVVPPPAVSSAAVSSSSVRSSAASSAQVSSVSDAALIAQGAQLYANTGCAGCHGADGKGNTKIDATKALYSGKPLANYIADAMPLGDPSACNLDCGTKIAAFIKSWLAPASCPTGSIVCETFEGATVGQVPAGWAGSGARIPTVVNTAAKGGTKSLKVSAFDFGQSGFISKSTIPGAHFGRVYYKFDRLTAADYLHIPMVTLHSATDGREVRIVDANSSAAGSASLNSMQYLINFPDDRDGAASGVFTSFNEAQTNWQCVEWESNPATQTYTVWVNGTQRISYKTNNLIPGNYSKLNVGMITFRGSEESAWIDDVVVASSRIGCN